MPTVKVTSKGQITIPAEVREELGLQPGGTVEFYKGANGDYAIRRPKGSIKELKGLLKKLGYVPDGPPPTIEEMNEAIGDAASESYLRSVRGRSSKDSEGEAA